MGTGAINDMFLGEQRRCEERSYSNGKPGQGCGCGRMQGFASLRFLKPWYTPPGLRPLGCRITKSEVQPTHVLFLYYRFPNVWSLQMDRTVLEIEHVDCLIVASQGSCAHHGDNIVHG